MTAAVQLDIVDAAEEANRPRLRIGSLFSGYGGLDMAVCDVLNAEVAWHCQYEPPDKKGREDKHQAAAKILAHHWPNVPNHGDVTRVDWTAVEPVDVLTAGFPCQPFSLAGRRQGADDERWLWDDIAKAIDALRPALIVLENVPGLLTSPGRQPDCVCGWNLRWGRDLGHLLNDHGRPHSVLAAAGGRDDEATGAQRFGAHLRRAPQALQASPDRARGNPALGDVRNARRVPAEAHAALPHGQARAGAVGAGDARTGMAARGQRSRDQVGPRGDEGVGGGEGPDRGAEPERDGGLGRGACDACGRALDDPEGGPVRRAMGNVLWSLSRLGFDASWRTLRASDIGAAHKRERIFVVAWPAPADTANVGHDRPGGPRTRRHGLAHRHPAAADAESERHGHTGAESERGFPAAVVGGGAAAGRRVDWGEYEPAIRRAEHVFGRPVPAPADEEACLSPVFVEWLMALPAGHVTAVPGLSRAQQIKALGNGVVPAQAAHALRLLLDRAPEALAALPAIDPARSL